jgi:GNAT superfamily N-acetyltransferase
MNDQLLLELLGYAASLLVAISLMMSSILRLRIINLIGALTFAVYGWLIGALPVAAVNLFIVFINIYYLWGMLGTREFFRLLEVSGSSEYVRYFLSHYQDEIRRFSPDSRTAEDAELTLLVLRDLVPAGLLMGDVEGSALRVKVDFVIPQYRDFKVGRYLFYDCADFFRNRGIREIVSPPGNRAHAKYLSEMGFDPIGEEGMATDYRLALS